MAIVNRRIKVMHIISGDLWAGAEVQAYTLLKKLETHFDLHVILMNPGELANRLVTESIPVTILDESKMGAVNIVAQIRTVMLSFKPDIIHTHRQKENILGSIANLLSLRCKSVRTSHGAPEFAAKGIRRLQSSLDRFIGSNVQHGIISVSDDLTRKLEKIFPKQKIYTIPNGVDVDRIRSEAGKAPQTKDNSKTRIGIIGRLEPVKRVDIFIQMAALLTAKDTQNALQFHIVGDGSQRVSLAQECKKIGIEDKVIFHGHRADIPALINELDMVVMCSDHEGTPMTALETLALGVPLVGHNVGGLTEILKSYPHLLVDEHTPQGYARVVERVIADNSGPVTLAKKYLASHNAGLTADLYKHLLRTV